MNVRTTRPVALGLAALALVVASGCSQQHSAERDGKQLGEAVCDLRTATSTEEVAAARAEVISQLDDLAVDYALFTAEDRADIDENLADMAEHAAQGNELLLQQDLAVIRRSADNIRDDVDDTGLAALDGLLQGLSDCTS